MDRDYSGTYPVIIGGEESGVLTVERQGLFWDFSAEAKMRQEVVRLSVYGGGAEGYLGVMSPGECDLVLHKKFSRASLSGFPEKIEFCAEKGLEPRQSGPETQDTPVTEPGDVSQEPVETFGAAAVSQDTADAAETVSRDAACKASVPESPPEQPCSPETESPPAEAPENAPAESGETPSGNSSNSPPAEYSAEENRMLSPQNGDVSPTYEMPPPPEYPPGWMPCPIPCSLFAAAGAKSLCGEIRGAVMRYGDNVTLLAIPLSSVGEVGPGLAEYFSASETINGVTYVVCRIKNGEPVM